MRAAQNSDRARAVRAKCRLCLTLPDPPFDQAKKSWEGARGVQCRLDNSPVKGGREGRFRIFEYLNFVHNPDLILPCAHGPSRAASSMLPYVREANEGTTSWIRSDRAQLQLAEDNFLFEIGQREVSQSHLDLTKL